MSNAPIAFTLAQWQQAYRDGQSPAELLHALRLELRTDDSAWIALASEAQLNSQLDTLSALLDAANGELSKLPLYGVPFAIKDNIDAAGWPTTAACPEFAYTAKADATVVTKLRAAGAILIGKTNLDQFATGLVGTRSPYGAASNSFDPAYVSGGSSSGSASVVARGLVPFAWAPTPPVPAAYRPRTGRFQQYCRTQTQQRLAVQQRPGASLQNAGLHLGICPDRQRCPERGTDCRRL